MQVGTGAAAQGASLRLPLPIAAGQTPQSRLCNGPVLWTDSGVLIDWRMPVWRGYAAGVRAYSMDLRERVVAAVDAGMTRSRAAVRRVRGVAAERGAVPAPPAGDRQPGGDRAAARAGAEGAPGAAGLAAEPPGRRRGCHAGRARGGVYRRRRP